MDRDKNSYSGERMKEELDYPCRELLIRVVSSVA